MKKLIIAFLAVFALAADASAQCGSQGRFPRARALVARITSPRAILPRLVAVVAPPKLLGLSGGCLPVFAPAAPVPMKK